MSNNQQTTTQEMDETAKRRKADRLADASKIVNEAVAEYRKELEDYTKNEENSPIMVEGETTTGYYCQMMVDPKDVASIILYHDYPVWRILGEEAPDAMWEDLGRKFGLSVVSSFDL